MALIKCKECGKEFSDKASQCIHCGCPIEKEEEKIFCIDCGNELKANDKVCSKCGCPTDNPKSKDSKNTNKPKKVKQNKGNKVIDVIRYLVGLFCFMFVFTSTGLSIVLILLSVVLILPITSKFIYEKINVPKALKIIVPIVLMVVAMIINPAFQEGYEKGLNESTNNSESNDKTTNENQEKVDTRTAKEKLTDYLKTTENATCDENKCTYTFSTSFTDGTDYYTVDFANKKFSIENKSNSGTIYKEYNYSTKKGYMKSVLTYAITTTTEVNVTISDDEKTFDWKCKSDLDNICDEDLAKTLVSLRDSLNTLCKNANVSINDL